MTRSALFRALFLVSSSLVLLGCDSETQERIDRLEAELREVRSDTRDEVADLKTRVITAETKIGFSQEDGSFSDRLGSLERSIDAFRTLGSRGNQIVYLRAGMTGHTLLHTDHGTFLVRIDGLDINIERGGYDAHLSIGNPYGFSINQFTLRGSHGGGTPELSEGEDYSLANPKIRAWQESLTPFEYRVTKPLAPLTWTTFDVEMKADSRDQLEVISFVMLVENADVTTDGMTGGQSENSVAHLKIGSQAASVMRTEYGAFLVNFISTEKSDAGTRVTLDIGNPYGFIIEEARLSGEYGPSVPSREASASTAEYRQRMTEWTTRLQPFEAALADKLFGLRKTQTTILIPAPEEEIQFLRCRLHIESLSLPQAAE